MSETTRVQRACLACKHPELLVGHVGLQAGFVAFLNPALRRSFLKGTSYLTQRLVCPNCGHVESVLKPEELAELQRRLGTPPSLS